MKCVYCCELCIESSRSGLHFLSGCDSTQGEAVQVSVCWARKNGSWAFEAQRYYSFSQANRRPDQSSLLIFIVDGKETSSAPIVSRSLLWSENLDEDQAKNNYIETAI